MENILLQQFSLEDMETMVRRVIQEEIRSIESSQEDKDELFTVDQAADFLKVSTMTIHNWKKLGILEPLHLGKRIYFDRKDVRKALEKSKNSF